MTATYGQLWLVRRCLASHANEEEYRIATKNKGQLAGTILMRLGDDLVGARTLESVRLPALDARAAVVDLELAAGEAGVGPWEPLSIKDKAHRIARRAAR